MNNKFVLYIVLFLLTEESMKGSFFAENKKEQQNELNVVKRFLEYQLMFWRVNLEQQNYEKSFMKKTHFTHNDLQEGEFFNPFLTNRIALMQMFRQEKIFSLANEDDCDIKRYTREKTKIVIPYIHERFIITTESNEPIEIHSFAPFFTMYMHCLLSNEDFYKAQMQEMRFLVALCAYNIQQGIVEQNTMNHFKFFPQYRNPRAFTTRMLNGAAMTGLLIEDTIDVVEEWRERIKESNAFIEKKYPEEHILLSIAEVKNYRNAMVKQVDPIVFSAFLQYKVAILSLDPKTQAKEHALRQRAEYTKEEIEAMESYRNDRKIAIEYNDQAIRDENELCKSFFNAHLNNRYEIMANLKNFEKNTAEEFDANVIQYIKSNFVITLNNKEVTDAFLCFFPALAFFVTFEEKVKNAECDEIFNLQCQCIQRIKEKKENSFSFNSKTIKNNSLASLIIDGNIDCLSMNVPQRLLKKASFYRAMLCTLFDRFSEESMRISMEQEAIFRGYLNGDLQLCQQHDKLRQGKNNHKCLSIPRIIEYAVNVDTALIESYVRNDKIYELKSYIQECAEKYQNKVIQYLKIKRISLKNHNDQEPYGKIYENIITHQPVLRHSIEQVFLKAIAPRIKTAAQYKELHKLVLLTQDEYYVRWNELKRIISLNDQGLNDQGLDNQGLNNQGDQEKGFKCIYGFTRSWSCWLEEKKLKPNYSLDSGPMFYPTRY